MHEELTRTEEEIRELDDLALEQVAGGMGKNQQQQQNNNGCR
jgi:hypothetical protein